MSITNGFARATKLILLFALALISVQPISAQNISEPVYAGYRDFSYDSGTVTSEPTEEKPE
ncbi:hypothetical protein L0244_05310, partial [bacterium]|nr:hypothetical protein [bacterium]